MPAAYLCGYGAGSLIAIVAFAAALGRLANHERASSRRVWLGVASTASLAVGILWIVHPI
jgi:cytochrome c biogenesis protein CcdA